MQNIELEISKIEATNSNKETNNETIIDINTFDKTLNDEFIEKTSDDISHIITKHLEKKRKDIKMSGNDADYISNHKSVMSYFNTEAKTRIKQKLANSIEKDINDIIYWRFCYRKIGNYFESISQIVTLSTTIVAFSAGYMDDKLLSFIAGCLGSISLALLKASSFSYKESGERNEQLNILLDTYKFEELPNITKEL
jgi:hypothetical protein